MAINSFFHNVKIDKNNVDNFIDCLEKASDKKHKNIKVDYKEVKDPEEIKEIFNRRNGNMLKPVNDFILLKEIDEVEEKTVGSFVLEAPNPQEQDARLKKYEVVAISDGYINPQTNTERTINEKIKPGVKVILDKYSGKKVINNNEEFYLVREAEIQAIEEEE